MLKLALLVCLAFIAEDAYGAMSEAQLKAALKLIRNVCQPKTKATDEQIAAMHQGNWDQDKNGQCYMRCILDMYKVMNGNTFNYEAAVATLKVQAPESMRDFAMTTMTNCKDAVKTDEKCASGFEVAKCMYFDNPEKFFLP